jgi:arabinogalactan endo-1,4-beta-galactosidase
MLSIYLLSFAFTSEAKAQVKGADLSWVTQMEASGYKWKDANGNYGDIFAICKGLGFNAVRLRVFVNPSNGWCNQADVVAKAKRAAAQGMGVYLTLHLSDTWADPGHQTPPAAWANHTISQLYTDVYNHVKTVVTAVRAVANVGWVSIGNETNDGLLWPLGKASTNPTNYAGLIRSGYNGAKAAGAPYVGVHVSNISDNAVWTWNFGILYNNGVSWDFCGASLYPTTSNYATLISQAKTTAANMKSKYGKNCVIAEFGIANNAGSTGATALKSARTICNDLFYWEPECYNWQGYGMGAWDASTQKPTVVLTSGLKSEEIDNMEPDKIGSDISVYPNPFTSGTLKVTLNGLSGPTTIKILNVNGQEVKSIAVVNQTSVDIDSGLAPGTYFVQIDNARQKEVKTLIVK